PGLPHPVAQVRRIAAGRQQDVSLPDPGDPPLLADAGQRCQLKDAQRLPAQVAHGQRRSAGDEAPGRGWPAHGVAVLRRRDTQGTGVGDRLAQQVDQRIADTRVLDASGREKEPHTCLLYVAVMTPLQESGDRVHEKTDWAPWRNSSSGVEPAGYG